MGRRYEPPSYEPPSYEPPTELPFRPGSMSWQVVREPAVIPVSSGRAVLLQVAHPLVAAGVSDYSSYQDAPWGRLYRTLDIMLKLAFADPATSERQQKVLRARHRRVKGTAPDGTPYDAMDPDLLMWVWATLFDTSLRAYERSVRGLRPIERERFYQENKLIAYACGVPQGHCPATLADFAEYWDRMVATDLTATDEALAVADAIRHPPLPGPAGRVLGRALALTTAGLLPPGLREDLGFRWSGAHERQLSRALLAARLLARVSPRAVREWPVAGFLQVSSSRRLGRAVRQITRPRRTPAGSPGVVVDVGDADVMVTEAMPGQST